MVCSEIFFLYDLILMLFCLCIYSGVVNSQDQRGLFALYIVIDWSTIFAHQLDIYFQCLNGIKTFCENSSRIKKRNIGITTYIILSRKIWVFQEKKQT